MKHINILNCPLCQSENHSEYLNTKDYFFTQENFSLSKCSSCDFVFTNPLPTNLDKYYETENYLSHNSDSKSLISSIYSSIRKINLKNKYSIIHKHIRKGNILDIGCGTGELLAYFKQHSWDTCGIEPNNNARELAISKYALNVMDEEQLETIKNETYDVVSMWHVLEHVDKLNPRIEQVKRITKKEGIMIFALPMLDSPDSIKYGKYWAALDVPRHLYHFTKSTFEKLTSKHGLKIIDSKPMKFDSFYISLLSEKYMNTIFQKPKAIFNGAISNFKANSSRNYSSMIFVVSKE